MQMVGVRGEGWGVMMVHQHQRQRQRQQQPTSAPPLRPSAPPPTSYSSLSSLSIVIILYEKPQAGCVRVPLTNATILLVFTTWGGRRVAVVVEWVGAARRG